VDKVVLAKLLSYLGGVLLAALEVVRNGIQQLFGLKKGDDVPPAVAEVREAVEEAVVAAAVREEAVAEAVAEVEAKVEEAKAAAPVEVANEIVKRRRGRPVGSKDSKPRARKS